MNGERGAADAGSAGLLLTDLVRSLPAAIPFVAPEAIERERGQPFEARLGANESAFGIAPEAQRSLAAALQGRDASWYPDPEHLELRQALAARHGVDVDEICVDAGIDSLLELTVRMLVESGAAVVTSLGGYPTFSYHVAGFGGELHTVPYRDCHEDLPALTELARGCRASLLYVANPDNPMGTMLDRTDIAAAVTALPPGCVLVLDEAYADFVAADVLPTIDTAQSNVIRYRTFSKAYGLAGMRIGYAIAHRELISGMNRIRNQFGVSRLSQIAALASLHDDVFLRDVVQQVDAGRERVRALAADLDLISVPSFTNFVAVDLGEAAHADRVLDVLAESGVFLRKPRVAKLDRFLRIGIGTEAEHAVLATALRAALKRRGVK